MNLARENPVLQSKSDSYQESNVEMTKCFFLGARCRQPNKQQSGLQCVGCRVLG